MEVVTNEKRSNQIDIHTHSTHSDGTFEVPQILEKAEELKLAILAITDHNSIGAYDDIQNKEAVSGNKAKEIAISILNNEV